MKAEISKIRSRLSPLVLGAAACLAALGSIVYAAPPYTFHPFCTYRVLSELTADVVVSGEVYSSSVVYQASQSRKWISVINSSGCKSTHGTALVYKLNNGNVALVPSGMCRKAEAELKRKGSVDIAKTCNRRHRPDGIAYFIDSAEHPKRWRELSSTDDFQIIEMRATSTWKSPRDNIDAVAPNILKSRFETKGSWWRSPERFLTFDRRSHSTKSFVFDVKKENF